MKRNIVLGLVSVLLCGWGGVHAIDMSDYVVIPHYCNESQLDDRFVCDGHYADLQWELDHAMDPFLDDYVDMLFDQYNGNSLLVREELDRLRMRVASFSSDPIATNDFLFVVEYVYYKISRVMESI